MCGVAGYLSKGARCGSLTASLASIRHRGPDAAGEWRAATHGGHVALGHVRLSVLDLAAAANQPFQSEDGTCAVSYNGEIFNFADLRQQLLRAGHSFRTHSDTEVLLASYLEWGTACVRRFEGMFAFALVDLRRDLLFLARDALGIKPLYYALNFADGQLVFASELRAVAVLQGKALQPDHASFAEFLLNGFLYEPRSGFTGISKLPPGTCAEIHLATLSFSLRSHFDPLHTQADETRDFESLLRESMNLQCVADVPVGIFFSGGTDSTALGLCAPRGLQALYADYGDHDETSDQKYATTIAHHLGFDLRLIASGPHDHEPDAILESFRKVARGTEEPISDYTYVATEALAIRARERGLKVMISGMGGDELFAGYPRYWPVRNRGHLRRLCPLLRAAEATLASSKRLSKRARRLVRFACEPDFVRAYTNLIGYFSSDDVCRLLGRQHPEHNLYEHLWQLLKPAQHLSLVKQAMLLDRYGFLAHNLTVADRASMAHGLEVRVPLLTRRLAALGMQIPDEELIRGFRMKQPIERLVARRIPGELARRPKVGFNPPLDGKIMALGAARIMNVLREGPFSSTCDLGLASSIVSAHFERKENNTYKLWQLLYFNEWLAVHSLRS